MPNLGPGVDQTLAPAVTPTWVFTPTPGVQSSVRLFNTGNISPVYIGGAAVTQQNGLPLYPGNRPVEFQNMNVPIYVASGASRGAAAGTISASATTAGTTVLTFASTAPTVLTVGATFMIGSTTNTSTLEANVVAATTATSTVTFVNPLLYDHAASSVVFLATPNIGSVRVTAGVG